MLTNETLSRETLLSGPAYAGDFETHVTVEPLGPTELDRFAQVCDELGVHAVLIELPRGAVRSQPMTRSNFRGTLPECHQSAITLANQLRKQGFAVSRIKIEAAPWNEDLPETDLHAQGLPEENYFEYHVKLILAGETDLREILRVCELRGAHLSANAFKRRDDGRFERFVTLRCPGVGRATANQRAQDLEQSLRATGHEVGRMVCEYCVYDSNQNVDAEWLEP